MYSVGGVEELRREVVPVPWSDPRFADPLMHHETFGNPIANGANPSTSMGAIGGNTGNKAGAKPKNPKRGGGGGRGGGSRGGGGGRSGGRSGGRTSQGNNRSHSSHGNNSDDDMNE